MYTTLVVSGSPRGRKSLELVGGRWAPSHIILVGAKGFRLRTNIRKRSQTAVEKKRTIHGMDSLAMCRQARRQHQRLYTINP